MPEARISARQIVLLPLFLAPFLVSIAAAATPPTCYWPNGDIAKGYTPCNEGANVSNCCGADAVCLDNGFCQNQDSFGNRLMRGACTDQTYGMGCTQTCADLFTGGQSSLILMGDFDPGVYCCGNPESQTKCGFATQGSTAPFKGPKAGRVIWDRKTGSTTQNTTIATVTVTAGAPTGTAGGPAGQCTAGAAAANDADGNPTSSSPKCTTTGNNATAIGAGVGVSLGTALAGVIALLIWQIRKRRAAERELQDLRSPSQSAGSDFVTPLYRDGPVEPVEQVKPAEYVAELSAYAKGNSDVSPYAYQSPAPTHAHPTTTGVEGDRT